MVDITTMANLYDDNDQSGVLDFVDDPVDTLSDTVPLLARQFFTPRRTWVFCQEFYAFENARHFTLGQSS